MNYPARCPIRKIRVGPPRKGLDVQGPEAHHVLGRAFFDHHGLDRNRLVEQYNQQYEQEKQDDRSRDA